MPSLVKLWDAEANDFVEMYSITASEALANDPKRYFQEKPEPKAEPPKAKPKDPSKDKD